MNVVENALRKTPCPFDEIFSQEGDGITGGNYITGVLWALEALSWNEEYLGRIAVILAELSSHDPGGNWANRPANSLKMILMPWYPQTLASSDKRISAIRAVRLDFPSVAWEVLQSLLPNQHQTSSGSHKPVWLGVISKDWKPKVTNKEYWDQITGYAKLAVEMAIEDLDRLSELVSNLDNLPKPSFDAVLDHLSSKIVTNLSETVRLPIWLNLTSFAMKHRRYSEAKWALDGDTISRIEIAANKLTPTSPEGLYRRFFSNRSLDLYEKNENWEEQDKKLDEKRQKAIQEIVECSGINGVIAFVELVGSADQVGQSLAIVSDSEIDSNLLPTYLDVENISYKRFLGGFVWSRYRHAGWIWVDSIDRAEWSLKQMCLFLMYLPFESETWQRVNKWLGVEKNMYWKQVEVNPYQSDGASVMAIDKLLEVGRPLAAIGCLNVRLHKKLPLEKSRVVKALLAAISTNEPTSNMDSYQIIELIKELQDDPEISEDDLFKVEWAYLPLLERDNDVEPKYLEKRLATQPEFFCEVIRLIYRSKYVEKSDDEPGEYTKNIATNAWRLLHEWRSPPGLSDNGFSALDFEVWFNSVKEQCADSGHFEVAMIKVGEVLFYCPVDPQGLWINQSVACTLNAIDADDMRSGFRTEVYNSRGVHWVDPTGKPERELAEKWRQKADAVENIGCARFASTLRSVAESFDRDADRIIEENTSEQIQESNDDENE